VMLRAIIATSQPRDANSRAVARPTPALAPVTTAITIRLDHPCSENLASLCWFRTRAVATTPDIVTSRLGRHRFRNVTRLSRVLPCEAWSTEWPKLKRRAHGALRAKPGNGRPR